MKIVNTLQHYVRFGYKTFVVDNFVLDDPSDFEEVLKDEYVYKNGKLFKALKNTGRNDAEAVRDAQQLFDDARGVCDDQGRLVGVHLIVMPFHKIQAPIKINLIGSLQLFHGDNIRVVGNLGVADQIERLIKQGNGINGPGVKHSGGDSNVGLPVFQHGNDPVSPVGGQDDGHVPFSQQLKIKVFQDIVRQADHRGHF